VSVNAQIHSIMIKRIKDYVHGANLNALNVEISMIAQLVPQLTFYRYLNVFRIVMYNSTKMEYIVYNAIGLVPHVVYYQPIVHHAHIRDIIMNILVY